MSASFKLSHRFTARRIAGLTAMIGTAGLLVSLLSPMSASADSAPVPDLGRPVPGASAPTNPEHVQSASSVTATATASHLPATGSFSLQTPVQPTSTSPTPKSAATTPLTTKSPNGKGVATVTGAWQQLGDSGVAVAAATSAVSTASASKSAPNSISSLTASIVGQRTAKQFGLSGLVIKLGRTDHGAGSANLAVRLPIKLLNGLYGADYAARTHWVQLPATKPAATPSKNLKAAKSVASTLDASGQNVVLSPQVNTAGVMLAAMSTPVSTTGTGSFTATSLKPATTWDVSAQTGDFSWQYPFQLPPAAAGPAPAVALSYDSQSVDGETGSTNNQPSVVGEGWSLGGGGFIERTYVSCSQDDGSGGAVASSGDLCWKTDNATISLAGHAGQLIKDATTGGWKLAQDDGSRLEHLVGTAQGCAANGTYDTDCWRLTTRDGTQYYFGLNELPGWSSGKPVTNSTWTVPVFGNDASEPCHAATFAASACTQAWRWNLDYVVDTHGNAEALYYDAETNSYSKNGTTVTSYVRGGQLDHIDYGLRSATIYGSNAASDKVVFGYDPYGRCSDATHAGCTTESVTGTGTAAAHPTNYPDVPFDQYCATGACAGLLSPTFWTTAMLDTVTTQVLAGGAYVPVDVWSLGHSFPSPGDGTNAALWLTQISHTGYDGSASLAEPLTTFSGLTMQNRVWAIDGLAPLDKYRISSITTSTGAAISVNYSPQQCTVAGAPAIEANPQSNTSRCFPQWWSPQVTPPQPVQEDLFHKYVVTSVIANPATGGGNDAAQETDYVYTGTPAWRYDTSPLTPDKQRTWSVFAGYNTIEIRVGDHNTPAAQQTTDYTFYQGMDGDRASTAGGTKSVSVTGWPGVADSLWFAGRTREVKTLNGVAGAVVSDTVTTPWASAITANDGVGTARMVNDADVTTSVPVSTGGTRSTETKTTYDSVYGLPTTVDAITSDAGTTCTTTSYATADTTHWILGFPKETAVVGVDCANLASATYPGQAISDTRTSYDGLAWGATVVRGDPTTVQVADSYTGTTAASAHFVTSAQTAYDALGRPTTVTDVLGHTTTTAYTPASGGPMTGETVTNTSPFNWTTSTVYNPARGVPVKATDQNGKVTTAAYDPLGRRTGVWLPSQPQATYPNSPSIGYSYTESRTAATAVSTSKIVAGNTVTSYTLYDGLGRPVQTQAGAEGGGTVVTDTAYDAAGRTSSTDNAYWTTSVNPSAVLFVPANPQQLPSVTTTAYDGAGRTTATILSSYATERYRTTYAYPGADRTDTTPPAGGTPTTSYTNSLGQQAKLIQYLAAAPNPAATQEATTYSYDPQGSMTGMVDPVGNRWSWGFDVLGHQVSATDPDTGTTTSTFDDAGNQLTSTDARGVTLAYSYDALNRKTAEYAGSTGSTGSELASWTFDSLAKGQLTSSTSYQGSTAGHPGLAYTSSVGGYDDNYNPTATTVSIPVGAPAFGGTSYTTNLYYYSDGAPASTVYPAEGGLPSERLRYGYDGFGRLGTLFGLSGYLQTTYTAIGQVGQLSRPGTNALYSTYGYDNATGAVTEIKDGTLTAGVYTVQADRQYTRDNAGDVTKAVTSGTVGVGGATGSDTQCFGYDYVHDLTAAWTPGAGDCTVAPAASGLGGPAPYWEAFTVDPGTGNRTNETITTPAGVVSRAAYTYPVAGGAHPHAVQQVTRTGGSSGTDGYGYDQAGDTTSRPGQSLSYGPTGRLASVSTGAGTQQDVYDASGMLLLRSDPSGSTLFLGDTQLSVAAGSSVVSAVRTYAGANDVPVAERSATAGVSGSVLTWVGTDVDGSADVEVAPTGSAVVHRFTDPYGNSRGTAAVWSSDHGFLNQVTDAFANVTVLGARAYDSTLGKFLSVDPILAPQNPQQSNGYAYAGNNPVTMADPSGLCYQLSGDVLNHNTGCVGSSGNPAGNGAATAGLGGAHASGGVTSSDWRPPAAGNRSAVTASAPGPTPSPRPNPVPEPLSPRADALQGQIDVQDAIVLGLSVWATAVELCDMVPDLDGVCLPSTESATDQLASADSVIAEDSQEVQAEVDAQAADREAQIGCGGESFAPDTGVVLADGSTVTVSGVRVGQKVLATDPVTGKTRAEPVQKVWVNHDTDLMDVTVSAAGVSSVIHATQHHLFWDATAKAWTEADHLRPGAVLRTDSGVVASVAKTEVVPGAGNMWDLTVATDHDFYVTAAETAVLVHNCPASSGEGYSTPRGRPYSAHYLNDTGPERNLPGSVVDEVIDHGSLMGDLPDRSIYFDKINNVTVVLSKTTGKVISAHKGGGAW
ncbi:RHS repeat-associated core domain-containing protein [Rathayibacter soli]|uniref:RHS repeat-associated core domain-containing protein n=1 Tax=Rathayibacter soli TaxID=3144168 RepID=UPI0027E560A3|nr:RHS repeat-associated core domain-containing protein [Glaciibacter superstes]